ncbi:MAG: DUF2264 domain-containing protein [Clostridia bacterium]|nr:DUF2264 domain-containing protein [Clostridia bacterium]
MTNARKYWLDTMLAIAEPVLTALADRNFHTVFPSAFHSSRAQYRCLEALGRTVCGMAPWLEADSLSAEETVIQKHFRDLTRQAIDSATDAASPDFMNFHNGSQPLVDAAFLAHGILRAPIELQRKLDDRVRTNLITALISTRSILPPESNWLLFGAMVEAALWKMGEKICEERVDIAISRFSDAWYVGDGTYSDGKWYHFDYYNSFVIHPMYLDVLQTFDRYSHLLPDALKRASRYAQILERMIAPDGSYPLIGRSVCYRFGAFQLLSQAALQEFLPRNLPPSQVRCALTAVIKKCVEGGLFDENGWLVPGVYGYQPNLAEDYINTGSLYLCTTVFTALGLPPHHAFWADPPNPMTSQTLWSGGQMDADHAAD